MEARMESFKTYPKLVVVVLESSDPKALAQMVAAEKNRRDDREAYTDYVFGTGPDGKWRHYAYVEFTEHVARD
jgi:hypothetical protein